MKQNEKDFQELNRHLKNLEHRYSLLSEEKVILKYFTNYVTNNLFYNK